MTLSTTKSNIDAVWTAVLLAISTVLIILEVHTPHTGHIRTSLAWLTHPISYVGETPRALVTYLGHRMTALDDLEQQIEDLTRQTRELHLLRQQYDALRRQYDDLEKLDPSWALNTYELVLVGISAVHMDPKRMEVVIDRGANAGFSSDMVVLDEHGVFGKIIDVQPYRSIVLTIGDTRHAIPVAADSGRRFIASGIGDPEVLVLDHVPLSAGLTIGEPLHTSGLGGVYPFGIPVGTVVAIEEDSATPELNVTVDVLAELSVSRFLYVFVEQDAPVEETEPSYTYFP